MRISYRFEVWLDFDVESEKKAVGRFLPPKGEWVDECFHATINGRGARAHEPPIAYAISTD